MGVLSNKEMKEKKKEETKIDNVKTNVQKFVIINRVRWPQAPIEGEATVWVDGKAFKIINQNYEIKEKDPEKAREIANYLIKHGFEDNSMSYQSDKGITEYKMIHPEKMTGIIKINGEAIYLKEGQYSTNDSKFVKVLVKYGFSLMGVVNHVKEKEEVKNVSKNSDDTGGSKGLK